MNTSYRSWILAMQPEEEQAIRDIPEGLLRELYPEIIRWGPAGAAIRKAFAGFESLDGETLNPIWKPMFDRQQESAIDKFRAVFTFSKTAPLNSWTRTIIPESKLELRQAIDETFIGKRDKVERKVRGSIQRMLCATAFAVVTEEVVEPQMEALHASTFVTAKFYGSSIIEAWEGLSACLKEIAH